MSKFEQLKQQCFRANLDLVKHGLVLATFGNASVLDRTAGVVAIKPSGVPYDQMKPEQMVVIDLQGRIIDGRLNPSSDTRTHLVLYSHFPEIGGIVHTHSTYAAAWAQAGQSIPILGTTHADYAHRDIPCTDFMTDEKIAGDYEIETGNLIVEKFRQLSYREIEMVLVAGHGPFTWGVSPEKAVHNSLILEELAKMAFLTVQINPEISRLKGSLVKKHFERKHGPEAYYGQKK